MSYDPPSQGQGDNRPEARYGPGGSPTEPVGGGPDYTPPPAGGGYSPPPSGGGYAPPPGGGYNAPPPTPPTSSGPSMGGMDQAGLQTLLQSWIAAVTKPNVGTYESEIPKASWIKVLIGVGLVTIVTLIINLIFAGVASASFNQLRDQLRAQGTDLPFDPGMLAAGGGIGGIIFTPLAFFLGAGLLYLLAKMFGGQGNDFMVHSYLLSLSYTPLRIVAALVNIVPIIGGFISIALSLYQLYCAGVSMQASQRLAPGKAQLAAFLPTIVGFILICLCSLLAIFGLAAAIGGTSR